MIKTKTFIYVLFLNICAGLPVQATSLDELYRDIVREDNSGYLPLFVKNRNAPEFILDEESLRQTAPNPPLIPLTQENNSVIDFENKRLLRKLEEETRLRQWQQTLEAVKENRVTPVELQAVAEKAEKNDPQAVEIYAYIYARGIGVKPDLIKAFRLYRKAGKLNVPNAGENAAKVYKAMTRKQRQKLSSS